MSLHRPALHLLRLLPVAEERPRRPADADEKSGRLRTSQLSSGSAACVLFNCSTVLLLLCVERPFSWLFRTGCSELVLSCSFPVLGFLRLGQAGAACRQRGVQLRLPLICFVREIEVVEGLSEGTSRGTGGLLFWASLRPCMSAR